jgi:hypothetical protein
MNKLRELLYEFYRNRKDFPERSKFETTEEIYDQAHSAILKLFKQEMLRLIGEDKIRTTEYTLEVTGYNQAKAELRKKVGEI